MEKVYKMLYGENDVPMRLKAERGHALAGNVQYLHRSYLYADERPAETDILIVPANAAAKPVVYGMPQGESAIVSEQVAQMQKLGKNVVAAVNADFFHFFHNGDKTTYGAQIIDGVVYKEPSLKERIGKNWFGVTVDGVYVISDVDGYESLYRGKLSQAVGGGDIIYQNAQVYLGENAELHPRTAVGIAEDGTLVIVCVDGRMESSAGANFAGLLQIFFELGYTYQSILNLDGGGSTVMVGKTENGPVEILNVPCTGIDNQRPVADILALVISE